MVKKLLPLTGVFLFLIIAGCNKTLIGPENTTTVLSVKTDASALHNNIVLLGGSTAWGKGASASKYTWVNKLQARLKTVDKSDTIINLAYPGYTTYHILANSTAIKNNRPETDTLRNITTALSKKPFLVIISLPSNDIANGYNNEEILNNYKTVVNLLKSKNVPYFLTSNQPRNLTVDQRYRLKTFSLLLVKTFPNHVVDYIDKLGDVLYYYKPMYNCGDGIHPNDKGHSVIYDAFVGYAPFKKVVGIK